MNDSYPPSSLPQQRSWLERISQVLMGEPKDREELIEVLRDAQQRHLLDGDALAMIEGVLQVSEIQVRDIMVPRSHMVVLERDATLEELLPKVTEAGHSRYPVIGDDKDQIIGILLAKDLLGYFLPERKGHFAIRDILRPAVFVPESKRLNVLLKEFRARRNHMAIVVDEYGGVAGLVTIEDVLEQIVGEIADEHDIEVAEAPIKQIGEMLYTVKAFTPIDEFNERLQAQLNEEEYDTIGGLVTQEFGRVPRRGETLTLDRYRFKVLNADGRRIHLLQVMVLPMGTLTETRGEQ